MPKASNNLRSLKSFAKVATKFCDCIDSLRDGKRHDLFARLEILLQRLHQGILPVRAEHPKRKVRFKRMTTEQWKEIGLVIRDAVGAEMLALRKRHYPTQAEIRDKEASDLKAGGATAASAGAWRYFREWCNQRNVGRDDAARAAMLWDDLAGIYGDLQNGLVLWTRKSIDAKAQAIWEWRFGYEYHWGNHLFRAMLTVHEIRYRLNEDDDFMSDE